MWPCGGRQGWSIYGPLGVSAPHGQLMNWRHWSALGGELIRAQAGSGHEAGPQGQGGHWDSASQHCLSRACWWPVDALLATSSEQHVHHQRCICPRPALPGESALPVASSSGPRPQEGLHRALTGTLTWSGAAWDSSFHDHQG